MADLRDFTGKNRKFTGVSGITVSEGAVTGDRVDEAGRLRFNTTNDLMEYYTGSEWKAIDAPPTVTTIAIAGGAAAASGYVDRTTGGNVSIVIAGSLFDTSNAVVTLIATSGSNITPATTTINNSTQITIVLPYSDFIDANEPYSVKVANPSGLSATLADAIYNDSVPTFTNAADTTYSIFDGSRSSGTIAAGDLLGATDAESDTITYSISSGALPSGFTLNTSTGAVTWSSVGAVGTDTTSTFTCTAAQSGGGASNARQFKITVKAPAVETFTSSGTFTVPTGLSSVDVLVVAGGGGSSYHHDGGGGAGGLIYRPGMPITPGSPITVTVGAGSTGHGGTAAANSVFSTLTALGGGVGGPGGQIPAYPGGSGAGATYDPANNGSVGTATQPGAGGDSGTYGFGNNGGSGFYTSPPTGANGGGGGGAGAGGNNAGPNNSGNGGAGRAYSISGSSVYYSGGGCGGAHQNAGSAVGGVGGGGSRTGGPGTVGTNGTANRGGGGGGGNDSGSSNNPDGGSGIVIVSY